MNPEEILRQAKQYTTYQPLNAVARARQYAALLMDLWKRDEKKPCTFKTYDECETDQAYYAQVRNLRPPRGKGAMVMKALRITNRTSLSYYRRILDLPFDV
jgi:hypothetical protein